MGKEEEEEEEREGEGEEEGTRDREEEDKNSDLVIISTIMVLRMQVDCNYPSCWMAVSYHKLSCFKLSSN